MSKKPAIVAKRSTPAAGAPLVGFPSWLTRLPGGAFVIDPNVAYPAVFRACGVPDKEIDQFWVETAYQCTKMAAQDIISGTEHDPRPASVLALIIDSDDDRKTNWALANHPAGRGAAAATKGRAARDLYERFNVGRALAAA